MCYICLYIYIYMYAYICIYLAETNSIQMQDLDMSFIKRNFGHGCSNMYVFL